MGGGGEREWGREGATGLDVSFCVINYYTSRKDFSLEQIFSKSSTSLAMPISSLKHRKSGSFKLYTEIRHTSNHNHT